MALNLSQALDFAIGVDNTSVNLVYLREVLVTVLKTLDIEDVVVGKWDSNDDECVSGEEEHVELDVVAEITRGEGGDEEREFSGCETEDITEGRDDDDSSIPSEKINEKGHEGDTVGTTVKRSTRGDHTRCHSDMDIFQVSSNLTRSESDFSKLFKFARRGYHSSLSSKVFVLEANVERLQDIVSNIIAQVNDKNNARNLNSGPPTQVCEGTGTADPGTLEDRVESIHQLEGCVGSRSLSPLEIGDENYGDSRPERETGRQTREELRKDSKGRPVTQPVFPSTTRLPVASRSKTANILSSRKRFARENSLLKQWKHRQTVSTIEEEVVEGELRTDGIISEGHCPEDVKQEYDEERNSGGKEDFGSDVGVDGECEWIDRVEEDETETNDDFPLTWSDTESGADTQDNLALDTPVAINDRGDPYPVVKSPHVSLQQMQLWREEFLTIEEKLRAELDAQWNFIRTLGNNVELLRSEDKDKDSGHVSELRRVHGLVGELHVKQTRLNKTLNELVDEYNRHESTFSEIFNFLEKLEEQKADKLLLSCEVKDKANKDDLRDKVSLSKFDESISLLDRALNDALEKMANQMSMEEALRETLDEVQSGIEIKLNRDEMENLRKELEARIQEVRSVQEKALAERKDRHEDPAGFKSITSTSTSTTILIDQCDRERL